MTPSSQRRSAAPVRVAWLALLLSGLGCAESNTGPIRLQDGDNVATIGTETRRAMVLQPEKAAQARLDVVLPQEPVLRFGFGVPNASLVKGHGATGFELVIEHGETREPLVARTINPRNVNERRWFDGELGLGEWAGEAVTLEFTAVAPPGGDVRTRLAFANPTITSRRHQPERPNLLVISLDTLRAGNVGAYGYARDTTPFLDALAADGTLFEQALTTSTTTAPSHMSLFSGLYPVHHGIRAGYSNKRAGPALASTLHAAGYRTAAFTENGFLVRERGFGDGFEEYTENHGSHIRGPGEVAKTFGQAAQWITQNPDPFFLFVHTYQVHAPFTPPPDYEALFTDEAVPLPGVTDAKMIEARDDYDREIRYTDDELRKLIGVLDARGLRENTLVVVLSDHGEEFLEHGAYQHGAAVFEETLRIPLVLSGPGVPAAVRVPDAVSLIDVYPTLLALLGLDAPEGLDGTNLLPVMRGDGVLEPRTLFAEAAATRRWTAPFQGEVWNPPLIAVRTPAEKWVVHRPWDGEPTEPVGFDLQADPLERDPQPLDAPTRARVSSIVDAYLGDAPTPSIPKPSELDAGERRRLELLGYVEEAPAP